MSLRSLPYTPRGGTARTCLRSSQRKTHQNLFFDRIVWYGARIRVFRRENEHEIPAAGPLETELLGKEQLVHRLQDSQVGAMAATQTWDTRDDPRKVKVLSVLQAEEKVRLIAIHDYTEEDISKLLPKAIHHLEDEGPNSLEIFRRNGIRGVDYYTYIQPLLWKF